MKTAIDKCLWLIYNAYGYLKHKEKQTMKVSKKQAKSQVSKVISWIVILGLTVYLTVTSSLWVASHLSGLNDQGKMLLGIFIAGLVATTIYNHLKKVL